MYRYVTTCRACGFPGGQSSTLKQSLSGAAAYSNSERLIPVFDLGIQPLANDFCESTGEHAGFAPLAVNLCPQCHLAQLSVAVRPEILYRHYRYVTSTSQTMRDHFQRILDIVPLQSRPMKFLEIGSNDGTLLAFLKSKGHKVLGVDPAENLAEKANRLGIDTICDFWGVRVAREMADWQPDFILARHVFCHIEDWHDFIAGIELVSGPETLTCIEVPYVKDLLEKGEFDTIYHEHTSYMTVQAISALLRGTKLRLHRIDRMEIHGGALFIQVRHVDSECAPDKSVTKMLMEENCGVESWQEFSIKSHAKIGALASFVDSARTNGKTVVGYGASAKSTVWVNACKFTRKQIAFITDTTPEKLYRFSPGSDIPITDEGALTRELPDYAIMFCWNFAEEVIAKEKLFLSKGGKFVIPHPEIKIVP